jgi:hypothetical protein
LAQSGRSHNKRLHDGRPRLAVSHQGTNKYCDRGRASLRASSRSRSELGRRPSRAQIVRDVAKLPNHLSIAEIEGRGITRTAKCDRADVTSLRDSALALTDGYPINGHLTAARVESSFVLSRVVMPAEYVSKPSAILTKLATMLRIVPALQLVFGKFAALLRSKESGDRVISESVDRTRSVTSHTADQPAAILKPSSDHAIAPQVTNDRSEREKLIRRRWSETGIRLWNPDLHGAGHAELNIQGQSKLLPPNPGEKLPRYDTLQFKMVRSDVEGQPVDRIVCEGVVVDAPERRSG